MYYPETLRWRTNFVLRQSPVPVVESVEGQGGTGGRRPGPHSPRCRTQILTPVPSAEEPFLTKRLLENRSGFVLHDTTLPGNTPTGEGSVVLYPWKVPTGPPDMSAPTKSKRDGPGSGPDRTGIHPPSLSPQSRPSPRS